MDRAASINFDEFERFLRPVLQGTAWILAIFKEFSLPVRFSVDLRLKACDKGQEFIDRKGKLMENYIYGPWIEHDGKGMPVDGDTLVCVRFLDGVNYGFDEVPLFAKDWDSVVPEHSHWYRDFSIDDEAAIVYYRLVTIGENE